MRFTLLISILLTLAFLSACQTSKTAKLEPKSTPANKTTAAPSDSVPRVTAEEAKKDFDAGTAVFVDTRSEYAYKMEHIKGAISLPLEMFEARYKEIPTDKKIIAYCD
jgi:predicted sulfurtransferase